MRFNADDGDWVREKNQVVTGGESSLCQIDGILHKMAEEESVSATDKSLEEAKAEETTAEKEPESKSKHLQYHLE